MKEHDQEMPEAQEPIEGTDVSSEQLVLESPLELLKLRCDAAGIAFTVEEIEGYRLVQIELGAGREKREVPLASDAEIEALLAVPFERYVLLGDFAAYCSYSDGFIEAMIRFLAPHSPRSLYKHLFGKPQGHGEEFGRYELAAGDGQPAIVVAPASPALQVLSSSVLTPSVRLAISIRGVTIDGFDQALTTLKKYAGSIFFQLDLISNIPLSLSRRPGPIRLHSGPSAERKTLEFPKQEYDEGPLSLYWYARSARGMPLLQFLAYYQTIEFYFPVHSQAEARRKVRNLLKNPSFRSDRDADVAKVLAAALSSGAGFGDERNQLRATLLECVEPGALRSYLTETDERADFFSKKAVGLTDHRVPVRNEDADLRNDVADRLYDIRCRIVHTKSGGRHGDVDLLLPFSKEAEQLYADIDLIRFIAREVLVAGSSSLVV